VRLRAICGVRPLDKADALPSRTSLHLIPQTTRRGHEVF
jgi:hypothetical protein